MTQLAKRLKRGLLFSVLPFFAAAYLRAAENGPQAVQVKIETVLASNQSDDFDPRLKALEKQLKVLKYRSYRLLKVETQNVPAKGSASFEIPGGGSLIVWPQDISKRRIVLKVRWQGLDTTITQPGNLILGGGPPYEGGRLALRVSATVQ